VSVGDDICGGVLVASDRVVTSSRCAEHVFVPERIRIGNARRIIVAVAMHREWVRRRLDPASRCADVDVMCTPDIALLRLNRPIRGVAIPRLSPARVGQRAVVVGHGTTAPDDDPTNPARLRAALLQIRSHEICRRRFPSLEDRVRMPAATTLCTTDPVPPRDAGICVGDGGAALIAGLRLFGIGSWSSGCGADGSPSIFTAVVPFRRFIVSRSTEWRPEKRGSATITGTGAVGATLECTPPRFTNSPDRLIFVFRTWAGGVMRQRGSASTYVVRDEDRGQAITCEVFAANDGGYALENSNTPVQIPR
jgi:hypothetical protein